MPYVKPYALSVSHISIRFQDVLLMDPSAGSAGTLSTALPRISSASLTWGLCQQVREQSLSVLRVHALVLAFAVCRGDAVEIVNMHAARQPDTIRSHADRQVHVPRICHYLSAVSIVDGLGPVLLAKRALPKNRPNLQLWPCFLISGLVRDRASAEAATSNFTWFLVVLDACSVHRNPDTLRCFRPFRPFMLLVSQHWCSSFYRHYALAWLDRVLLGCHLREKWPSTE